MLSLSIRLMEEKINAIIVVLWHHAEKKLERWLMDICYMLTNPCHSTS